MNYKQTHSMNTYQKHSIIEEWISTYNDLIYTKIKIGQIK